MQMIQTPKNRLCEEAGVRVLFSKYIEEPRPAPTGTRAHTHQEM